MCQLQKKGKIVYFYDTVRTAFTDNGSHLGCTGSVF